MTNPVEIPGAPVPVYHNESWKLISQGAEARVWLVPNFITNCFQDPSRDDKRNKITSTVICKERFPKAYRHPSLDETLTRSRTKAEARNLTKCRRGGVSVPLMLGIDLNRNKIGDESDGIKSACLFMEHVHGCTIRNYINMEVDDVVGSSKTDSSPDDSTSSSEAEPPSKKQKCNENESVGKAPKNKKIVTRKCKNAKKVSYAVGVAIGKMHNVNIIHGDLTTSNIMMRNPPNSETNSSTTTDDENWDPDIVLIDFGLSSTSVNTKKTSCHEERAVDLYVLERAFVTTHVGSEDLVAEVMRGYKASCKNSDSVFVRLAQVRLRGRKRECFG
jgi:TP53 regulating kinase-like protein